MPATDYVQAKTSFFAKGGGYLVQKGDVFAADDPVVRANRDAFGPLLVRHSAAPAPIVEQATAAPGQRRGRRAAVPA